MLLLLEGELFLNPYPCLQVFPRILKRKVAKGYKYSDLGTQIQGASIYFRSLFLGEPNVVNSEIFPQFSSALHRLLFEKIRKIRYVPYSLYYLIFS